MIERVVIVRERDAVVATEGIAGKELFRCSVERYGDGEAAVCMRGDLSNLPPERALTLIGDCEAFISSQK